MLVHGNICGANYERKLVRTITGNNTEDPQHAFFQSGLSAIGDY